MRSRLLNVRSVGDDWMIVDSSWYDNGGKTEVLGGKTLSQRHAVHHISHMAWSGIEPGSP